MSAPDRFTQTKELTLGELDALAQIKAKAAELEALYAKVPFGRRNALAMTSLEQSVMWIEKEIRS